MGHHTLSLLLVATAVGIATGHAIDRAALPTLYEHYTAGGIKSGLVADGSKFLLNGKEIRLITGTIHYFRVHPDYWRDRLRKLRAGGFVGVETYIPWNLHQPEINSFDFGAGGNDFSPFLNVTKFLKMAQEEDLLVVLRPGPFINAEWENGGLPSWLYRDSSVKTRSSESHYISYMTKYFNTLFPILKKLQFAEGGPILAFQIENEYGTVARRQAVKDTAYLKTILSQMESHGLTALKFTSDSILSSGNAGEVPGALMTGNLNGLVEEALTKLKQLQPNKPLWIMEYWTGTWDHWFDTHHTRATATHIRYLQQILAFPANANLYVFIGGTDFGFMNSATWYGTFPKYKSDVSSYDYDAPLTEAGDYTEKYTATVKLIADYLVVKTKLPALPAESVKMAFPTTKINQRLSLSELVHQVDKAEQETSTNVKAMELLNINQNSGQSYGFILYRKTNLNIPANSVVKIAGSIHDLALLMVNGIRKTEVFKTSNQQKDFGFFGADSNAHLTLDSASVGKSQILDILVENWGRRDDMKGIVNGSVLLNNAAVHNWDIFALEFKGNWVRRYTTVAQDAQTSHGLLLQGGHVSVVLWSDEFISRQLSITDWLSNWHAMGQMTEPTLFRAALSITEPHDTFINMSGWGKGSVFVNGFNIGRYFSAAGPAKTLYIPAPLLNKGKNEILVFELYSAASEIVFSKVPILG